MYHLHMPGWFNRMHMPTRHGMMTGMYNMLHDERFWGFVVLFAFLVMLLMIGIFYRPATTGLEPGMPANMYFPYTR